MPKIIYSTKEEPICGTDNYYYYLYKITNKLNNKFYIGVHKTKNLNDGYFGSGVLIKEAIAKYGIENFFKEILRFFTTSEDMYAEEKYIVSESLLLDPNCYNLTYGGLGYKEGSLTGIPITKEHKEHIRQSKINYYKTHKHILLGVTYEDRYEPDKLKEMKEKLSNAQAKENNGFYNKKHTKDSIDKIKQTLSARKAETLPYYGAKWFYNINTLERKYVYKEEIQKYDADINWKRGMGSKTNSIPKYITVIQYDKDMNVIQTFHSYKEIKDCGYRIGKIRTSALNNNIYKNSYWFIEE